MVQILAVTGKIELGFIVGVAIKEGAASLLPRALAGNRGIIVGEPFRGPPSVTLVDIGGRVANCRRPGTGPRDAEYKNPGGSGCRRRKATSLPGRPRHRPEESGLLIGPAR